MHFILPFAQLKNGDYATALADNSLSKFANWLHSCEQVHQSPNYRLSLPDEILLAKLHNLPTQDGLIAWAAYEAQQKQLYRENSYWAQLNLCHWQVTTQQITLLPLAALALTRIEERQLLVDLQQLFAADNISLYPTATPGRWLAQSPLFKDLPMPSYQRLLLRQPSSELLGSLDTSAGKQLLRLQQEAQMLLYRHPVNEQRLASAELAVNGLVFSNSGSIVAPELLRPLRRQDLNLGESQIDSSADLVLIHWLTAAAIKQNVAEWRRQWLALEQLLLPQLQQIARQKKTFRFSLCGENCYRSYTIANRAWWQQRLRQCFGAKITINQLLEPLL